MKAFCRAYALNPNGAEAYLAAYPISAKHTPQYRAQKASVLIKQAKIQAEIERLRFTVKDIADTKFEITAERILQELAAMAFANADDYYAWGTQNHPVLKKDGSQVFDEQGQPVVDVLPFVAVKPSESLTRLQKAAIVGAEMSFSKDGSPMVAVKMGDKRAALRDLGQALGLFKMGIEAGGKGGAPIQIVISSAEAAL